ncbi:MAG: HdeD family acid-resistance protein [Actinomycetales bacterium]
MLELMRRSATTLFILGGLATLFGVLALAWPVATALTLVILWGAYALVDGVMALVMAFRPEGRSARGFLIFTGVVGVLAGLIALFRPFTSAVALAIVVGVWLIVRGVFEIVAAFSSSPGRSRWLLVLAGVLWLIAGGLFLFNPGAAAVSLSIWFGVLAILWGVLMIGGGFAVRAQAKDASDGLSS